MKFKINSAARLASAEIMAAKIVLVTADAKGTVDILVTALQKADVKVTRVKNLAPVQKSWAISTNADYNTVTDVLSGIGFTVDRTKSRGGRFPWKKRGLGTVVIDQTARDVTVFVIG